MPCSRKTEQHSFRSVGIAMAPAITLNRMYHCVPSKSSTMDPTPRPPPTRISKSSTTGKAPWPERKLRFAPAAARCGPVAVEADGDAGRDRPERAEQQRRFTRRKVAPRPRPASESQRLQATEKHHDADNSVPAREQARPPARARSRSSTGCAAQRSLARARREKYSIKCSLRGCTVCLRICARPRE